MGSERGAPLKTQAPNRPRSCSLPLSKAFPLPTKATSCEARQQKIPGSLPMPRPLPAAGRRGQQSQESSLSRPGQTPWASSAASCCTPLPGQVALLWYVPMTLTRAGPKQGWLPPAMLQRTLEVVGRGNPWNQQQSSCLAATQALNAP